MEKRQLLTNIIRYGGPEELAANDAALLEEARACLPRAYAPYSGYRVAAALRMTDGTVVTGTNQENAAYPSGLCAERVAFFSASHRFPDAEFEAVAIIASSDKIDVNYAVAPCGGCRQVMLEYRLKQDKPIRVILSGSRGEVIVVEDTRDLLPLYFHEEGLKKAK